jgi:putative aldouronate transport system substrate-binding protein
MRKGNNMKRVCKTSIIFTLILIISTGFVFARGDKENGKKGETLTIFIGRPKEDYPPDGTILGKILEEKTGVRLKWEFPVGDLRQKIGLIIAGGDYPDLIDGRGENQHLYDDGALIPLNDLIEKYGVHSKKLYRDKIEMLKKEDGNIYWLPQYFPYGDKIKRTTEGMGLYIQKAILKEYNWPMPKNVNEAFDMLIDYAQKHPEIDGNKTYAFTALTYGWREFPLMNAPHVFSGHPNDGSCSVDWVNGKWVASRFYDTEDTYKIYKLYNKIHLAGLYDTESFVMDYDQYLAKLSTGSILAFHDQNWQFRQVNTLLKEQGNDRWYVGLPVVKENK